VSGTAAVCVRYCCSLCQVLLQSVSGTAAECVIIALNKIMNRKPDLILSGVNIGSNVGDDICY
jgi:5'/3'-nucleotidase SurE